MTRAKKLNEITRGSSMSVIGFNNRYVRKTALLAIAAVGCVSAFSSQAAVIDSGPINIAIPATLDGLYLNIATGVSGATGAATPGWDINPYGATNRLFFWTSSATTDGGGDAVASVYRNLAIGDVVGPASTFFNSAQAAAAANFNTGTPGTKRIGFRFLNEAGSTVHYGYAELTSADADGVPGAITRYVFESTPNTAITVALGATAPQFAYAPAIGSTVTATGGGFIGSTGALTITPSIGTAGAGTGTGATTTLTCTAPTAPFSGFGQTVTAIGTGAISGGPLSGACTLGAAAVTQTLTCNENRGGTANARTWTLSCPAGTAAPVQAVDTLGNLAKLLMLLAVLGVGLIAVRRD